METILTKEAINGLSPEVVEKLKVVENETFKGLSEVEAIKKSISNAELDEIADRLGVAKGVAINKSMVGGLSSLEETKTFFSKYKFYFIGGGILILLISAIFLLKKKGK